MLDPQNTAPAPIPIERPLKLVFLGAPAFAEPSLATLAAGPDQVALVITPPDRPAGRGRQLASPPIKQLAQQLGLPVYQPANLKDPQVLKTVAAYNPDLLVVAAYGLKLPPAFLDLGRWPPVNIHPSLLPAHRGPAPAPWAIIKGDQASGVSIIFLTSEMDAGPVLKQAISPIGPEETGGELEERLARLGADLLSQAIAGLKAGALKGQPQDESQATHNRLLTKTDGQIDWFRPAGELLAQIRGLTPWPGAHTYLDGRRIKILRAVSPPQEAPGARPGQVLGLVETALGLPALAVAASPGAILLTELQPEGKKPLGAADFFRGYRPHLFENPSPHAT